MYINDVLSQVEQYYPHEYSRLEMYKWCDEVSAMITEEVTNTYKEICLPLDHNNTILLPEDIDIERVYEIRIGNRIIDKQDLRTFGKHKFFTKNMLGITVDSRPPGIDHASVVYIAPYERIRALKYMGGINVFSDGFYIPYPDFRVGDIVDVSFLDSAGTATSKQRLNIFGREYDINKDMYKYITSPVTLDEGDNENCKVIRYVTDRTVCDAPYDTMYIDYVMARIAQYQRDTDKQNIYRVDFNSKMLAYKNWLADKKPRDEDKIINWW